MRTRLEPLNRLKTLYKIVEENHAVELQRAEAASHEAQSSVDAEMEIATSARHDGHRAISSGDHLGWAVAEAQRRAAVLKREWLETVRNERACAREAAKEQYLASRLKNEQMQRVSANVAEQIAAAEEKELQAATDDRFAARKKWKNKRDERRRPQRMKAS